MSKRDPDPKLNSLMELITAMGFMPKSTVAGDVIFLHDRAKECRCGKKPHIEPSRYESGKWVAICPNCAIRTELAANPIQAVSYWNKENYTRESRLTMDKLTKENMFDAGAMYLTEAMKKSAVEDLMLTEKSGMLDTPLADQAKWFINNDKVVEDIVSGERRRREEAEGEALKRELKNMRRRKNR